MANLLFTAFSDLPVGERNLSRWIILEPAARELSQDWKTVAAETVGALRVDVGRHPNDPQANQLVGELAVTSERFRQWWADNRVMMRSCGAVRLHHPTVATLSLNSTPMTCLTLGTRACGSIRPNQAPPRTMPCGS